MARQAISRRHFLKATAAAFAFTLSTGMAGCTGIISSAGNSERNRDDGPPSVERSALFAVRDCMGARADEDVLIVTDPLRKDLGVPLYEAALLLGCNASYLEMGQCTRSGEEPADDVARAMQDADVVIAVTTYSLTHTDATRNACASGARVGSMPIQSEDSELVRNIFATGGMTADPWQIGRIAKNLVKRLKSVSEIRITSERGTDVTFKIQKGYWISDIGLVTGGGGLTNLPGGEVLTMPADTNGIIVIDGSFGDYGLLSSPLELTIENGRCTGTKGQHADDLDRLFAELGDDARNVAELGIGINPAAQVCGIILEDEKAFDTIHIALGDNTTFGGNVHVPIHFDGIVRHPRIEADGEVIDISQYR